MYNVSSAFRAAIQSKSRTDKISGKITLTNETEIPIIDSDIKSGSLKIDNQCVNGDELEFGAVYAGQLVFTMKTDVNRYALYNGQIVLEYSLLLQNGTWETVPMGVYWITEAIRQGVYIKITALDAMIKLQTDFDGVATLGTPFQILTRFAEETGVPLLNTESEIKAMPNGGMIFQIDSTCGCSAWVDAVAIIAQMMGAFATATRDGGFAIRQFHKTSDLEVVPDQRFDTSISDYKSGYMGLYVTDKNGNVYESYSEADDGLVMEIDDNPLFDVGLEPHKQELVENIRGELCGIVYTPSDISCVSDPTIECGDGVTYTVDGDVIFSIVTSYVWQYRGDETLKAVGKNPYLTNTKNRAQKQTAGLRQQLNDTKIVFESFTNSAAYKVTQTETRIVQMAVTSIAESNAVFIAQILADISTDSEEKTITGTVTESGATKTVSFNFTDSKPCELTFVYYINGEEVAEFHPVDHYDAGSHILTLFYPLPDMEKNTTNRFIVGVKADSGSAFIDIEQIKATMIGQGLATGGKVWDGTITITEMLPLANVETNGTVGVNSMVDGVSTVIDKPTGNVFAETFGLTHVFTNGTVGANGLTERLSFTVAVKSWTMTNASVSYNGAYIIADETGYTMRTTWNYESTDETIDSGLMCVVQTNTDGLETVESVVVENE